MIKIKPLGDRVVLEAVTEEQKTKSGIYLPDTADKEKPEQGKVVAVGPGKMEEGKRIPLEVKVGDTVLFTKYGPNEVKVDNKEYLIAREEDTVAVLEKIPMSKSPCPIKSKIWLSNSEIESLDIYLTFEL